MMFELPFFLIKTALAVLVAIGITQIRMQSAVLINTIKTPCYNYAISFVRYYILYEYQWLSVHTHFPTALSRLSIKISSPIQFKRV